VSSLAVSACPGCGTELAPALRSCPACQRLVHADELRQLADVATRAERAGDLSAALSAWRGALELLPPGTRQHASVAASVEALSRSLDTQPAASKLPAWLRWTGPVGVVLVFLATKAKLLLTGLTKAGTLLSMLASLGVYWAAWGWKFALGLVVSMYIHEMGHVAALQHFGIKATAPMFVPGFGAFVRMHQYPASAREDARVGLAGPAWGLGAALAAYVAFAVTGAPILAGIAVWGARLNLFNLVPLGSLDGGRGLRPLSRGQRALLVLVLAVALYASGEKLLWLLLLVAAFRALEAGEREPDWTGFLQFAGLVALLAALSSVDVPLPR
jgi:Zn-dependent protease